MQVGKAAEPSENQCKPVDAGVDTHAAIESTARAQVSDLGSLNERLQNDLLRSAAPITTEKNVAENAGVPRSDGPVVMTAATPSSKASEGDSNRRS